MVPNEMPEMNVLAVRLMLPLYRTSCGIAEEAIECGCVSGVACLRVRVSCICGFRWQVHLMSYSRRQRQLCFNKSAVYPALSNASSPIVCGVQLLR